MSESITLDPPGTKPAGQAAATEPPAPSAPEVTVAEPHASGDAEAIRTAQEALERANKERDDARRQATQHRSEAARLRDEAARANSGRVADRKVALAQTIQAAKSQYEQAEAAFIAAGESGDFKAQAEANKVLQSALYRGNSAEAELASLGDGTAEPISRTDPRPTGQSQEHVPGPRARQWLSDNPQMETDQDFREAALMAHNQAIRKGWAPETDDYMNHIERSVAGFRHGQAVHRDPPKPPANGGTQMPANPTNGGHSSQAGPSNRGGSGNSNGLPAGWRPVQLIDGLGTVSVHETPDGKVRFNFPDQGAYDNMEEGAKVCYPELFQKDPKQAIGVYTRDQVVIAREREAGGTAGLTRGDGREFR